MKKLIYILILIPFVISAQEIIQPELIYDKDNNLAWTHKVDVFENYLSRYMDKKTKIDDKNGNWALYDCVTDDAVIYRQFKSNGIKVTEVVHSGNEIRYFVDSNLEWEIRGREIYFEGKFYTPPITAVYYSSSSSDTLDVFESVYRDGNYLIVEFEPGQYPVYIDPSIIVTPIVAFDTYVYQGSSGTNYNTAVSMVVGIGSGGGATELRSIIRIDTLDYLPANAVIDSALGFFVRVGGFNDNINIAWYWLTEEPTFAQVTWDDRKTGTGWTTAGGVFDVNGIASDTVLIAGAATYKFSFTALVQAVVDSGYNYGFIATGAPNLDNDNRSFATSDAGASEPEYRIYYHISVPTGDVLTGSRGTIIREAPGNKLTDPTKRKQKVISQARKKG